MYIERCKHGSGASIWKPTIAIWQGGSFLLYYKYKKALEEGKSKKEAREISQRKGG